MKKVLIIAYFFPPLGWSGVQRTLKFVKYLRSFGWEPIVVTVGNTSFFIKDETLNDDIPENLEVIRVDEFNFQEYAENLKNQFLAFTAPQLMLLNEEFVNFYINSFDTNFKVIEKLLSIPDGQTLWAYDVLKTLESKINFKDIDLIYSTSGPYSDHLIGYNLKEKYNIPWIVDFRDEWTNNPYFKLNKENLLFKLQKDLEIKILNFADKILTISLISKNNYINNFNIEESKIEVIKNGYDEEDFKDLSLNKDISKFTIICNGSLHLSINPKTFLLSINNLISKNILDKNKIEIKFIGTCDKQIHDEVVQMDVNNVVKFIDYLPHKESLLHALNADLLLLIVGEDPKVKSVYTGKIFEYLKLKNPILALSPKESVIEQLLNETGCGKNIEFNNISGIENYITAQYNNWLNDNMKLNINEEEIKKYDRKNLTHILSKVLDEVIEKVNPNNL